MAEHQIHNSWVEPRVRELARDFQWPATPDIYGALQGRPLSRVTRMLRPLTLAASLLIAIGLVMAIPPVRSAVIEWIQAGAVTLFRWLDDEPLDSERFQPADQLLLSVATRVTLLQAEAATPFALATPSWPEDLGEADEVWLHRSGAEANVIMIWREAGGAPRLALYQIGSDDFLRKGVRDLVITQVDGQQAVWTHGPHLLQRPGGGFSSWALIEDHVLIWWTDGGPTYRLETRLPMAYATRIAESLQILNP